NGRHVGDWSRVSQVIRQTRRSRISVWLLEANPCFCPGGTIENSPVFQRRVVVKNKMSPEGTAEKARDETVSSEPSLRDFLFTASTRHSNTGLFSSIPPG